MRNSPLTPTTETRISAKRETQEFDLRNGNDAVVADGYLVFSNGARREIHPFGLLEEPPTDPQRRARLQLAYRERLLSTTINEFESLRSRLQFLAKSSRDSDLPNRSDLEDLRRLRRRVQERQLDVSDFIDLLVTAQQETHRETADGQSEILAALERIRI